MSQDPYEILGVERDADVQTIRKAYRKLAAKFHPDQNPDDPKAEERFKEVAGAWEILGDEDRRSHYDRYGRDTGTGEGFPGGFQTDFSADMFSELFDFFGGGSILSLSSLLLYDQGQVLEAKAGVYAQPLRSIFYLRDDSFALLVLPSVHPGYA